MDVSVEGDKIKVGKKLYDINAAADLIQRLIEDAREFQQCLYLLEVENDELREKE